MALNQIKIVIVLIAICIASGCTSRFQKNHLRDVVQSRGSIGLVIEATTYRSHGSFLNYHGGSFSDELAEYFFVDISRVDFEKPDTVVDAIQIGSIGENDGIYYVSFRPEEGGTIFVSGISNSCAIVAGRCQEVKSLFGRLREEKAFPVSTSNHLFVYSCGNYFDTTMIDDVKFESVVRGECPESNSQESSFRTAEMSDDHAYFYHEKYAYRDIGGRPGPALNVDDACGMEKNGGYSNQGYYKYQSVDGRLQVFYENESTNQVAYCEPFSENVHSIWADRSKVVAGGLIPTVWKRFVRPGVMWSFVMGLEDDPDIILKSLDFTSGDAKTIRLNVHLVRRPSSTFPSTIVLQ